MRLDALDVSLRWRVVLLHWNLREVSDDRVFVNFIQARLELFLGLQCFLQCIFRID